MTWFEDRNRRIYVAWLNGTPVADLAARWCLAVSTVETIIQRERKKEKRG